MSYGRHNGLTRQQAAQRQPQADARRAESYRRPQAAGPQADDRGERRVEDVVMPFGKHKGKTLGDILVADPAYLDWVQDKLTSRNLAEAVKEMCRKYEPEIEAAISKRDWER